MDVNEHRTIEFAGHAGLRLHGDAAGPEDGLPVLLLHGGGQTRRSWGAALEALAAHGAHAVAIDLRGHGDSDWSPAGAYLPLDFAQDVDPAVRTLSARSGDRPVLLVGASMGGLAALAATPGLGHLVAGLVLVDVVPQLRLDGAARIVEFMLSAPDGFASVDEAADAVAAYLPHRPRPSDHDGLLRNLRQRPDGRWDWHWDPRVVSGARHELGSILAGLNEAAAAVTVPTLLIRGRLSDVVDDEGVADLQGLLPHLQVVDVATAAHTAAADDNDAFVSALLAFADRIAQTASSGASEPR